MEKEGSAQDIWLASETGDRDDSPRAEDVDKHDHRKPERATESVSPEPKPKRDAEDLSDLADPEDGDEAPRENKAAEPTDASNPDEIDRTVDERLAESGVDAPAEVDEMMPADTAEGTAEKEPKRSRGKRDKKKDADGRKPTDQQVLERLLEKNELILQLSKKNAELEAGYNALKEKRVQLLAEFENYRKRTRKEWDLLKGQAKAEVIVEILQVVDDFERALAALGEQNNEFVQGIKLIHNNLLATLAKFGVTKMIALGEAFDPNYHMAVASIDTDEVPANHIVEIAQEGYLMGGNVIRPANVVIAK